MQTHEIVEAFHQGHITFNIQPQYKYSDGSVELIGGELLASWVRGGERLSPLSYMPALINEGFESAWFLDCLDQCMSMDLPVPVSLNVSARLVEDPLFQELCRAHFGHGSCVCERIKFEVTESLAPQSFQRFKQAIREMGSMGYSVSLDDFGTGHANINWIVLQGVSEIKIDRSFVHGASDSVVMRAVLRGVVSIASEVGLSVIYEGVERQNDIDALVEMGADRFQGYFFSKPMPVEDFLSLSGGASLFHLKN